MDIKIDFKFNERELRRQVEKAAQAGIDQIAKDWTRDMERLSSQYKGRPAATIKPALRRLFQQHGGSITEPELSQYAQAISDGIKIVFKPQRPKL